jgi:hypothetical protein
VWLDLGVVRRQVPEALRSPSLEHDVRPDQRRRSERTQDPSARRRVSAVDLRDRRAQPIRRGATFHEALRDGA